MSSDDEFDRLFPNTDCLAAIGELSAWTSVFDIAAAARCMAETPNPEDAFDTQLIVPFANDDIFEAVLMKAFGWLIASYKVPLQKIVLAAEIEPCLTAERQELIKAVSFRPTVSAGTSDLLPSVAPKVEITPGDRFLLVQDDAHVIELIQAPIRCMMGRLRDSYETSSKARGIRQTGFEKTVGKATIFHRPYADSRLPAVLEALCFYGCGLELGPYVATLGKGDIEQAYKAVNVRMRPPVDTNLLDNAKLLTANLLESLT